VGEIRDEYDDPQPEEWRHEADGEDLDAAMHLSDFAELSGLDVPQGPYSTVAGLVLERLGHLARVGDAIELEGRTLTVTAVEGRRIARLHLTAPPAQADEPADERTD